MHFFSRSFAILAILAVASCARAEQGPKIGEAPPVIQLDEWISSPAETAGKPVLLEFWATWCPPCRASIPHLNEIHAKYKDKGLVIVGVSDEEAAGIKEFQKSTPMNYPNGISKTLVGQYGVQGIPHAFLIGKDGKLLWRGHPMRLTDADIEKALQ
jgi:thiol-disulfide isomerase/thioredoxin